MGIFEIGGFLLYICMVGRPGRATMVRGERDGSRDGTPSLCFFLE